MGIYGLKMKYFLPSQYYRFFFPHSSVLWRVQDALELGAHSRQKSLKFPKAKAMVWYKGWIKLISIII